MMESDWCQLMDSPLPVGDAVARVTCPAAGGVAVFLGTTREEVHANGAELVALDYEAYADLAGKQLHDLARRARERWPMICRIALAHRTGRVGLGEPSVVIAVSTPHRAEAFDVCRWLIDTLKAEVAVWKKEVWSDGGTAWVDPQ